MSADLLLHIIFSTEIMMTRDYNTTWSYIVAVPNRTLSRRTLERYNWFFPSSTYLFYTQGWLNLQVTDVSILFLPTLSTLSIGLYISFYEIRVDMHDNDRQED